MNLGTRLAITVFAVQAAVVSTAAWTGVAGQLRELERLGEAALAPVLAHLAADARRAAGPGDAAKLQEAASRLAASRGVKELLVTVPGGRVVAASDPARIGRRFAAVANDEWRAMEVSDGDRPVSVAWVRVDRAWLQPERRRAMTVGAAIALAGLLAGAATSLWVGATLSRRLGRLRAEVAAAGPAGDGVEAAPGDEIDEVRRAYRRMAKRVGLTLAETARSEARFRALVEGSDQGMCVDRDDRLLFANVALARMLGYASAEAVAAVGGFLELVAPHDRPRVRERAACAGSGAPRQAPERFDARRVDGSEITVDCVAQPVEWDGEPAVLRTLVDLTAERLAEERARAARVRLAEALESLEEGIVLYGPDERLVAWNRRVCELYPGIEPFLARGRHFQDVARDIAASGIIADAAGREDAWLHERYAAFKDPDGPMRQRLEDGRIIDIIERRTPSGGNVGIRADVTERVRAEEALAQSERRYRDFTDSAADWLWELDAGLRITRLEGGRFEEATGVAPDDLIGRARMDLVDPTLNDPEDIRRQRELLEGHLPVRGLRARWRNHRDGSLRVLSSDAKPLFDEQGAFTGYRGTTRDVTEQARAESRQAAQAAELEALYRAQPDLCFRVAADTTVLDFKPGSEFGPHVPPERFLGRRMCEVLPEPAAGRCRDLVARVAATGVGETVEYPLPGESGEDHFEARAVPLGGEQVFVLVREITARVEARRRLRASEARFRGMVAAGADWFWELDEKLCFVSIGGGNYDEVIGTPGEAYVGRTRIEAMSGHPVPPEVLARHRADLEAHRPFRDFEFPWLSAADGEVHVLSVSGRPWFDADGRFRGYHGVSRDVTELRQAAEERERLAARLTQAQKLEALGQLAGGIAHDFNNILGSVMGYTDLARRRLGEDADPRLARYLGEVRRAGERARDVVAQILAYGRGLPGEPRTVTPEALVDSASQLLRSTLPASLTLEVVCPRGLPPVHVDPVQMDQVLMNLCVNARDAAGDSGRVTLAVTAGRAGAACASCGERAVGEWVSIAVRDSGPGVPEALLSRVFEPFFTTKAVGSGSGMGLSLVHGIVHEHGGHLLLDRPAGGGAKFTVLLPPAPGPTGEAEAAPEAGPPPGRARRGARVLVVDDDRAVAAYVGEVLESGGMAADVYTSSRRALEHFRDAPDRFDLLVTDHAMPDMDGAELVAALRAMRPGLPVVTCTGYADRARAGSAASLDPLLVKPVSPDTLLGAVARLLPHRG